ncbi:Exosome complex component rrp4 [Fusarium oxysporum f. sp. albedinis]|nr:Exosome complex component rrp4 [Fusarium oxysporum f. sp. albedinis]
MEFGELNGNTHKSIFMIVINDRGPTKRRRSPAEFPNQRYYAIFCHLPPMVCGAFLAKTLPLQLDKVYGPLVSIEGYS